MLDRLRAAATLAALLSITAPSAYAQAPTRCGDDADPAAVARASALFVRAQDELDAGRATAAEALARAVLEQQQSPNARLFLGRTLRAQSRWAAAYEQFDRAARDASACAQREPARRARYAQTVRAAIEDRDAIASRVGLLLFRPAQPVRSDAVVRIGDQEHGYVADRPIPVAPGSVRFTFVARGFEPVERAVDVLAAQVTECPIELRATATLARPAVVVASAPPIDRALAPRELGGGVPFALAIGGAALGVAAVGAGGALFGISDTQFQALSAQCSANGCPSHAAFAADIDQGERFERVGVALLITGAATLVTSAIALIVVRPRAATAQRQETR